MRHRKETLTALIFLAMLGFALIYLLQLAAGGQSDLRKELGKLRREPSYVTEFLKTAEGALNKDLDREHNFIQLYGGFQRLTGRRVMEDVNQAARVVRLDNGCLNFSYLHDSPMDISGRAEAVSGLSQHLASLGIPYLYVTAPQKLEPDRPMLPPGLKNFSDDNADRLQEALEADGVSVLDLRPAFSGKHSDLFFRTDHHWTPEGAFLGWQVLTETLERDYGIHTDPLYTCPDSYDRPVYEDFFLGSQGKRVGSLYAGTDDITMFIPRFPTDFSYTCPFYGIDRSGPFEESLLFPERVEQRDLFGRNPYTLYAGGDYPLATMTNHLNPDGKKIVLLRESFSCALAPFLALSCSELTTIDLRYFQGDLTDTLAGLDPDLVLSLYSVSSINQDAMFDFGL